jgi:branched-chain amino acid transport system substrate-binding protein
MAGIRRNAEKRSPLGRSVKQFPGPGRVADPEAADGGSGLRCAAMRRKIAQGCQERHPGRQTMPITRRAVVAAAAAASAGLSHAHAAPGAGPPLVFGALFPFSGEAAILGDESFRGLSIATDALNAAGGLLRRQVTLTRGDALDADHATTAAKALTGATKADAIFGTAATPMALAGSEVAALAGVPYFELTATGAAVTGRGLPTVFRSCPQPASFAAVSVAAVIDVLAPLWNRAPASLRLALLDNSSGLGQAMAAAQAAECHRRGLTVVQTLAYPPNTVDFAPLIRALSGARIEVLLHTGFANDVVLLYRGMQEAGWRPRMVIGCGPAYAMADTRQAVGPTLDGTLAVDFPPFAISPHAAPGAAAVEAAYRTRYGAPPRSGLSLAAYVGAGIFFGAIARAGTIEKEKLRQAVLASNVACDTTANSWGAAFGKDGQNRRAATVLLQWQQGQPVTVHPADVAVARPHGDFAGPLPPPPVAAPVSPRAAPAAPVPPPPGKSP